MNKLSNLFKTGRGGLVEKGQGRGLSIFNYKFQTREQRLRSLLSDTEVQNLLMVAYDMRRDDLLNGISAPRTGKEVSKRVKDIVL